MSCIGGSNSESELAKLSDMTTGCVPVNPQEFSQRLSKAQNLMQESGIDLMYLHAGTNLKYFLGTSWHPSERLVGALVPQQGDPVYIAPHFEKPTLQQYMGVEALVHCWHEHENPYALVTNLAAKMVGNKPRLALDESSPFFVTDGIMQLLQAEFINASAITAPCRMIKSDTELAIMQRAKAMTLEVQKSAARILQSGISTTEVERFIHAAHQKVGAPGGSYFVIVLFGEATAYPHGVKEPQVLKEGDTVLIDTGCRLHDYISDITRTYVYGEPTQRQREVWSAEKAAQAAAFSAAKVGHTCASVDTAARQELEKFGFGPGYALPGLPHRTGHGIGMDIHEWPYLNSGDQTVLKSGMCFSNEPMICIPGEFGIRLEDHFYMTDSGPAWFTQPSFSIDEPFR